MLVWFVFVGLVVVGVVMVCELLSGIYFEIDFFCIVVVVC